MAVLFDIFVTLFRMKKFSLKLSVAFLVVCQLASSVAFAQETTGAPATPTAAAPDIKKSVELSSELTLFMEVYFVQLKAKAFAKAYGATSSDFKKTMKLADFSKMMTASGLSDFTGKTWVDKQWDPKTGLINIRGEFVRGEKETHTVSFQLVKKGETYEVLGITETLTIPLLSSMFPKEAALQSLLRDELLGIAKMVKNGSFRKFYNGMAKMARASIKFGSFKKALRAFKKEKKDIALAADTAITVAEGFPKIDTNGNVSVKGEYTNDTYVVFFTLGYNYEWEWRVNTLNINPVLIADVPAHRAKMAADAAAAKKAAEEAAKKAADEAAAAKAKADADASAAAPAKVEEKK